MAARSSHFRRLLQRSVLGGGRFSGVSTFPIGPIRGRAIAFPRAAQVRLLHEYGEEVVNLPDPASLTESEGRVVRARERGIGSEG